MLERKDKKGKFVKDPRFVEKRFCCEENGDRKWERVKGIRKRGRKERLEKEH